MFLMLLTCVGYMYNPVCQSFFAEIEEDVEIKKVHGTKYKNDEADLDAQAFNCFAGIDDVIIYLQSVNGITNVDEVKTYEQQVVYTIGQFLVAVKNFYEKYFAILKKSAGNPDGNANSSYQVQTIGDDDVVHDD